jgi:hypothetical protein
MSDKADRLYARADAIIERRANGFAAPILRHLALRRYGPAMLAVASNATASGEGAALGRISDPRSPAGMMYRAHRLGEYTAAQNFALTLFYGGDLAGYRHWLRKAARIGDEDALAELRRFELRQPYPLARRVGRIRPRRRSEIRLYQS